MQAQNQRADPRVDVDLEVQYRTAQEFNAAYTKNISGGGIFIKTQQALPLNQEIHLRFTLPGISHILEVRGLVVWTNPYPSRSSFPPGMGIKFMDLDSETKKIIAGFVKEKLPAAAPEQKPSGA
jgi:type IV pilus assembly protein PilZ